MTRVPAPSEDTQPVRPYAAPKPAARKPWLLQRGRWLLTSLILITSCTIVVTVALFVKAMGSGKRRRSCDRTTATITYIVLEHARFS